MAFGQVLDLFLVNWNFVVISDYQAFPSGPQLGANLERDAFLHPTAECHLKKRWDGISTFSANHLQETMAYHLPCLKRHY